MQLCELELRSEGNIIKHKKIVQKIMFFNFKIKEASSLDQINMTKFWSEYDWKIFTPTNLNVGTWPKIYTNEQVKILVKKK